jgi:flagellar motor component MotA
MRVVGLILALVVLMAGIGSNLSAMIDPPSAIIVLGFTLGALLLGGSDIPLMLRGISPAALAPDELAASAKGWKMARFHSLAAGAAGSIIGWIIMLQNLDDPGAIGPGMAISLLTVMYGLFLAFVVCLPLQANIAKRLPDSEDGSVTVTAVLAALLSVFVAIASFGILLTTLD